MPHPAAVPAARARSRSTAPSDDAVPRVGCDLADAAEVAASIARFGERYLARVYTPAERAHTGDAPERLAARFAAKEAVIKLLGPVPDAPLVYRDIEIVADASGAPVVHLADRAARLAAARGIGPIAVSLSHERGLAAATAVALCRSAHAGRPATAESTTTGRAAS